MPDRTNDQTLLYLVRHGATAENEQRPVVLQGAGVDGPLSEAGREQAAAVAEFLSKFPLAGVYASPMRRARETAERIAERHQLAVLARDELHEVDVGDWEGRTWTDIMEEDGDYYERFMSSGEVSYRGGESYRGVLERVRPVFERLLDHHAGESICVVAHNVVNRVYCAALLGLELRHARGVRQANCGVNVIRRKRGETQLVTLNSEFHLR